MRRDRRERARAVAEGAEHRRAGSRRAPCHPPRLPREGQDRLAARCEAALRRPQRRESIGSVEIEDSRLFGGRHADGGVLVQQFATDGDGKRIDGLRTRQATSTLSGFELFRLVDKRGVEALRHRSSGSSSAAVAAPLSRSVPVSVVIAEHAEHCAATSRTGRNRSRTTGFWLCARRTIVRTNATAQSSARLNGSMPPLGRSALAGTAKNSRQHQQVPRLAQTPVSRSLPLARIQRRELIDAL